jgi:hypothetical protein
VRHDAPGSRGLGAQCCGLGGRPHRQRFAGQDGQDVSGDHERNSHKPVFSGDRDRPHPLQHVLHVMYRLAGVEAAA